MTVPVTIRELFEAGVYFGHKTYRWNPKMATYIYGVHKNIHIIDLSKTLTSLVRAMNAIRSIVKNGGRVLFVGTKIQAREAIEEAAKRSGQYYVNQRWLGGTLTNWKTVSVSIHRLRALQEKMGTEEFQEYTKKEQLGFRRELERLEKNLGGIKDMGGVPDAIFVLDTNRECIAVSEARRLGIPVFAVVDTNSNPDVIDYPIPGNDDALRAIHLYCDMIARAVIEGLQAELQHSGVDLHRENPEAYSSSTEQEDLMKALKSDEDGSSSSGKEAVSEGDSGASSRSDAISAPSDASDVSDSSDSSSDSSDSSEKAE